MQTPQEYLRPLLTTSRPHPGSSVHGAQGRGPHLRPPSPGSCWTMATAAELAEGALGECGRHPHRPAPQPHLPGGSGHTSAPGLLKGSGQLAAGAAATVRGSDPPCWQVFKGSDKKASPPPPLLCQMSPHQDPTILWHQQNTCSENQKHDRKEQRWLLRPRGSPGESAGEFPRPLSRPSTASPPPQCLGPFVLNILSKLHLVINCKSQTPSWRLLCVPRGVRTGREPPPRRRSAREHRPQSQGLKIHIRSSRRG